MTSDKKRAIVRRHRRGNVVTNPYRAVSVGFIAMVLLGTVVLMLPIARTGAPPWPDGTVVPQMGPTLGRGAPLSVAFFTSVSASCVTGLIVADTATYWTTFGHMVITVLMHVGGLGTMTVAYFIVSQLRHKLSVRQRATAVTAASSPHQGHLSVTLKRIIQIALATQGIGAFFIGVRLWLGYHYSFIRALWYGIFHSASAYNNAGFALYTDSLMSFDHDPWIIGCVSALIILGGLGFPVISEIIREHGIRSLQAHIMVRGTATLILIGTVFIAVIEWKNPRTLGGLSPGAKILNAFFSSVSPRTAGFNSVDISSMHPTTWFGTDFLMFIGAGSASTAGGIKITAIAVILAITWSQIRGYQRVHVMRWSLSPDVQGQVITLMGLSVILVSAATMALMLLTPFNLDRCLFEAVSAFATVGISTGITPHLSIGAQGVIEILMMVGRLGPVTLASSLALRNRRVLYDFPLSRPLIG